MGAINPDEIQYIFKEQSDKMVSALIADVEQFHPPKVLTSCQRIVEAVDALINLYPSLHGDPNLFSEIMSLHVNSVIQKDARYQKLKSRLIGTTGALPIERIESFIGDYAAANTLLPSRRHPALANCMSISTIGKLFQYVSERRKYFVTFLSLTSEFASGEKDLDDWEVLESILFCIEVYCVPITTARNIRLLDLCYDDFKAYVVEGTVTWNKDDTYLEGLSLDPKRLTILDQIEYGKGDVLSEYKSTRPSGMMFSFEELEDVLAMYQCVFNGYAVDSIGIFQDLNQLIPMLRQFVVDDYLIKVPLCEFKKLSEQFPKLVLTVKSIDYYKHLNSVAPFTSCETHYYTNTVLFTRFISHWLTIKLERSKRYQIHSGFIFERRAMGVLEKHGFIDTEIHRINRKEFDLITTRDGEAFNFQCKNNLFEVSLIDENIQKTAKINKRLCDYYIQAYEKEVKREDLIKNKLGVDKVTHYVISRFPVMSAEDFFIPFNKLDSWLSENVD